MKLKLIILLAFTLSLVSCNIQELTIGNPNDVKVEELSMKAVRLQIMVPIENPNNFSFKVKNVNLDLIVNGRNVGKVKKMDKVQIPANSKGTYPISFEITPSDALTNILFLMRELQNRSPDLEIDGTVTVAKLGVPYKIKVNHKETLDKF